MKKIKYILLLLLIVLTINGIYNNIRVVETKYNLASDKVNQDYTFVQISDYHSKTGKDDQILKIVTENAPNYILLTGDILESDEMEPTLSFVQKLTEISTVVYTRGNHDDDYNTYEQFRAKLVDMGVILLSEDSYQVDDLNIIGIEDWSGASLTKSSQFASEYTNYIEQYSEQVDNSKYNVLLAHRPNFLEAYSKLGVDLVLSGHAHGGQWQIPFTDIGLLAPDEGLFPTNVHGLKTNGDTTQIISSGNSNPYAPIVPRLFNPEEVVVVNLTHTETE